MEEIQFDGGLALRINGPLVEADEGSARLYSAINVASGDPMVVKVVPVSAGAGREVDVSKLLSGDHSNVIPVVDSTVINDSLALAMPRAETSLAAFVQQSGRLELSNALAVLRDVATALESIRGSIVHRDIKPENILLLNGTWRLADFGISRLADAATAVATHKRAKSWRYASPEQCRDERATEASDIYSFGVVAYQLVQGELPFPGPGAEDFREQHLHSVPPAMDSGPIPLRALIEDCLDKAPGSRPTAGAVLNTLESLNASDAPSAGSQLLQKAGYAAVKRRTEESAAQAAERTESERLASLFDSAEKQFGRIEEALRERLHRDGGPELLLRSGNDLSAAADKAMSFEASLGSGELGLTRCCRSDDRWSGPFTVVAEAKIIARQVSEDGRRWGRSHSLWYCDAKEEGVYRWYELAFMSNPFSQGVPEPFEPFAWEPKPSENCFLQIIGGPQLAWPVSKIVEEDFLDRWVGWFGEAALGRLHRPSTMPERPTSGSWRL